MVLVLENLTFEEFNAIGQSIIGLDNPDLSMFPIGQRDQILSSAVKTLASNLKGGREVVASSKKIAPLLEQITQDYIKNSTSYEVERAAEQMDLGSEEQVQVYLGLGKPNKILEITRKLLEPEKRDNLFYSLDHILKLYEIAGENLNKDSLRRIGVTYLSNNNHPQRLSQVYNLFKNSRIKFNFTDLARIELIKASESQLMYRLSSQGSDEENKGLDNIKLVETIFKPLIKDLETHIDYTTFAIGTRHYSTALTLVNGLLKRKNSINEKRINSAITTYAAQVIDASNFGISKMLSESIGNDFDYDKAFEKFISTIEENKHWFYSPSWMGPSEGNFIMPLGFQEKTYEHVRLMAQTLISAPEDKLREMADKLYHKISDDASFRRKNPSGIAYSLVKEAYKKLDENPEIVSEIGRKLTRRIRYYGRQEEQSSNEDLHFFDEVKLEQKNLGDVLLEIDGFVDSVIKAYDQNGFEGVHETIMEYGSKLNEDDFTHNYSADPISLLNTAFHNKGRQQTEEDTLRMIRYGLTHGTEYGAYQTEDISDPHKVNPLNAGLSVAGLLLGDLSNPSDAVDQAETFSEIFASENGHENSEVPSVLYRFAAASELKMITKPPISYGEDFEIDTRSFWQALQFYKKLGDQGLISFIQNNFDVN